MSAKILSTTSYMCATFLERAVEVGSFSLFNPVNSPPSTLAHHCGGKFMNAHTEREQKSILFFLLHHRNSNNSNRNNYWVRYKWAKLHCFLGMPFFGVTLAWFVRKLKNLSIEHTWSTNDAYSQEIPLESESNRQIARA